MIALILVSHSAKIADGTADLIREMAPDCPLASAAGVDDPEHPIGTDAVKIITALEAFAEHQGIAILVDLGSAILSAQTALDLIDPALAAKTRIAAAPLVEGALSAAIASANGADLAGVVREAENALAPKRQALGGGHAAAQNGAPAPSAQTPHHTADVRAAHGLHARPAAKLVAALRGLDADCELEYDGRRANPKSLNSLIALAIPHGARITLYAGGKDAEKALSAFAALAADNFGDRAD